MYDFVHRHKRALEIVLVVLIVPPFALFGVDWYFRGGDSPDQVASVGDGGRVRKGAAARKFVARSGSGSSVG